MQEPSAENIKMLQLLCKSTIAQILKNLQHNANARKQCLHSQKPGYCPKKVISMNALEYSKEIAMSNARIANLFLVRRNLAAWHIQHYGAIVPRFVYHANKEARNMLHEATHLSNNLGK